MRKPYKVGVLLYDFVDILDFSGPSEVLSLTAFSNLQQKIILYKRVLPKKDLLKLNHFRNQEIRLKLMQESLLTQIFV